MKAYLATVLAIGALLSYVQASNRPHCFAAVPNVVQAGVEQKVSVSVFNVNNVPMIVQVEQGRMVIHNAGRQILSHGSPRDFTILIPLQTVYSVPPTVVIRVFSENPGLLNYNRDIRVVLSTKIDSVFVQTDKPVYIRDDIVHVRFVGVRYDLLPLDVLREVCVDIKNPQDVLVDRFFLNITSAPGQNAAIIKKDIALGPSPVVGIWKIIAKHGLDNNVTSEYKFEVKDYVLPRFGVSIIPPSSVAITDDHINFGVKAKYTYGQGVTGKAHIRLGVWNEEKNKAHVFTSVVSDLLRNDKGTREFTFPNQFQVAFPNGKRLFIHVEVIEEASGVNESTSDRSAFFTYEPIVLDCDLTPPFYKPNLPFLLTVRARYRNGNPALANVELDGKQSAKTNSKDGTAAFFINVGDVSAEQTFKLNVRGQNNFKLCKFEKFESPTCDGSAGSIAVRLKQLGEVKIGTPVDFEVVKSNSVAKRIPLTAIITSCGVIRKTVYFLSELGPITSCTITFDEDTCSKATVFVYYINTCNQVVAAITTVDVEQRCPNDVRLEVDNSQTHAPGSRADLVIVAAVNSDISLLTVDRGLYLLNSKNKLTKEQVFADLLNYDKSCGYTSRNTNGLFAAAGLTASTSAVLSLTSRKSEECPARRRREIRSSEEASCLTTVCGHGRRIRAALSHPNDVYRICNEELRKLQTGEKRLHGGCLLTDELQEELSKCCLSNMKDLIIRARRSNVDFSEPEEFEDNIQVRSFFPHVLSDYFNNGDESRMTKTLTLPDSISEFQIQALAFSSRKGFCVSKPVFIRTFKPVFVECHMPFSFRRQEQGTLKCTAYNYDDSEQA